MRKKNLRIVLYAVVLMGTLGVIRWISAYATVMAETEFEKYRIIQDRLYESDFDRFLQLEEEVK